MTRFTATKMLITVVGVALATFAVSSQAACHADEKVCSKSLEVSLTDLADNEAGTARQSCDVVRG